MPKNMDESQNNYSQWKKPEKKVHSVWFHLYNTLENANWSIMAQSRSMIAEELGGEEREEGSMKGQEETLRGYQTGTLELTFCRMATQGRGGGRVDQDFGWLVILLAAQSWCVSRLQLPYLGHPFVVRSPWFWGPLYLVPSCGVTDSLADLLHCPPKLLRPAGFSWDLYLSATLRWSFFS